jgi:hypothetical protein
VALLDQNILFFKKKTWLSKEYSYPEPDILGHFSILSAAITEYEVLVNLIIVEFYLVYHSEN